MQLDNLSPLHNNIVPTLSWNPLRQTLRFRIVERLLSKDRRPLPLPLLRIVSSRQRSMRDGSIIPVRDATRLPFPADGEIIRTVEVLAQEIEGMDAFLALQLCDVDDEKRVVEKGL